MSDTHTNIPQGTADKPARRPDETATNSINLDESTFSPVRLNLTKTSGATALAPVIQIDALYYAPPGTISQIVTALELLKQADENLIAARKSDNPIDRDCYVQRVQISLPRLFVCRSIGEGFAVIINAIHFGFVNLKGKPLTSSQLNALWLVLRELRAHPALTLEQGIRRVEDLEESGLEVDPPDLDELVRGLDLAEND